MEEAALSEATPLREDETEAAAGEREAAAGETEAAAGETKAAAGATEAAAGSGHVDGQLIPPLNEKGFAIFPCVDVPRPPACAHAPRLCP